MRQLIKIILSFGLIRACYASLVDKYSPEQCKEAFVEAMNQKSKEWGMNNTHWINPSGLGEDDVYSQTTANDMAIMAAHAFAIGGGKTHHLLKYELNMLKPYLIPNHRRKRRIVVSTTPIETIGDNYPIIGAKTGSGDGYQTLVMVSEIGNCMVSGAIMNAQDEEARFDAMNELMLIGKEILVDNHAAATFTVHNARNACLYAIDEQGAMRSIFTQNADEQSAPMSTSKVMTLSIVRDYIHDEMKERYVYPSDLKGAGSDVVQEWDRVTIKDLIHAMMLESSNASSNALARIVGYMILEKKNAK